MLGSLSVCRSIVLGIRESDTMLRYLKSFAQEHTNREIILLNSANSIHRDHSFSEFDRLFRFVDVQPQGVFLSKPSLRPSKLSYVEIVQQQQATDSSEINSNVNSHGGRKVSTSTISTQPEVDRWDEPDEVDVDRQSSVSDRVEGPPSESIRASKGDSSPSETESLGSYETNRSSERISIGRRELLAKRRHIGLRAVVPCPTEEPEKRIYTQISAYKRAFDFHSQSS